VIAAILLLPSEAMWAQHMQQRGEKCFSSTSQLMSTSRMLGREQFLHIDTEQFLHIDRESSVCTCVCATLPILGNLQLEIYFGKFNKSI
jgi:hypothetical protein